MLSNNGQIFSTGSNKQGQLGIGNEEENEEEDSEEEKENEVLGKKDNAFIPG
jgi:alpha-tubulin suppressor-like RCC1 family protein